MHLTPYVSRVYLRSLDVTAATLGGSDCMLMRRGDSEGMRRRRGGSDCMLTRRDQHGSPAMLAACACTDHKPTTSSTSSSTSSSSGDAHAADGV